MGERLGSVKWRPDPGSIAAMQPIFGAFRVSAIYGYRSRNAATEEVTTLAARRATLQTADTTGVERQEVASYVAALSRDLSEMSRRSGLSTLAYLLDMARLEADLAARGGEAAAPSAPGVDLP